VSTMSDEPLSFGEYALQIRDGDIVSPKVEIREPLKEQCRHFVDCVRRGATPLTSAWQGRDVLRVLEAAERSMQLKGAQVEVARNECFANYQRAA
jgi:predicted dehydrogenase